MRTYAAVLTSLAISQSMAGDIVMDQIGPMDGSMVSDPFEANQYFEDKFASYSIATIDSFDVIEPIHISMVEFVLGGWNGFIDPSSIAFYETNIYTTSDDAGASLSGNLASDVIDSADIQLSSEWQGEGYLVECPTSLNIEDIGSYWFSVIPQNNFGTHGQTGIAISELGDGVLAMQANPGGAFGFGPLQQLQSEMAVRLISGEMQDPCLDVLPAKCPEDINGDSVVAMADLLLVISNWNSCGDGETRPIGDIAPLPSGDCCVDLIDLLAIISAWGSDCNDYGPCCLDTGTCEEAITESECISYGGFYGGNNSSCQDIECVTGICCIDDTCLELTANGCESKGGSFIESSDGCISFDCGSLTEGDECNESLVAVIGQNAFNTTFMTPSTPAPSDETCAESNLNWSDSPDVWFNYTPKSSGFYRFSTCDTQSYDTSMVLYQGSCVAQIACNGDSLIEGDEGPCQLYYSSIEHELNQGVTYYIRIGGWQGETGPGTLSVINLPDPLPGACCFTDGNCIDNLTGQDCENFGGFFAGEETTCSSSLCEAAEGDECNQATEAFEGLNPFNTTSATPSEPFPDDAMCEGTFLDWGKSPDIWMYWIASETGDATFTTCDIGSFDTSIVLYEGDCANQVACNGDGFGEPDCQEYYSSITYEVESGTTYLIRIGGWQGQTGLGTMSVNLTTPQDVGACCFGEDCVDLVTQKDCLSGNGVWHAFDECSNVTCYNMGDCQDAVIVQNPTSPAENWFAATSASDSDNGINYMRAEYVNASSVSSVKVWGLQLRFDDTESEWYSCDEGLTFNIRVFEDSKGLPGELIQEALSISATKISTGLLYGGLYELHQWEIPFSSDNVPHLSVQSASEQLDCWFLWMNSQEGDGYSSNYSTSGWLPDQIDLSICINE